VRRHLPRANQAVSVWCNDGFAQSAADLSQGDRELELRLSAGGHLRVLVSGEAAEGAPVGLQDEGQGWSFQGRLDATGLASFDEIPPGHYVVYVDAGENGLVHSTAEVASAQTTELRIGQ
jgi:hypothetical protein